MRNAGTAETTPARPTAPRSGAVFEFLLWTFVGGPLIALSVGAISSGAVGGTLGNILPAVIALVVARRRGIRLTDWGLCVVDRRVLVGPGIALGIVAITTLIALATGIGPAADAELPLGLRASLAVAPLPVFFVAGLGQELGWRGLLITELGRRGVGPAVSLAAVAGTLWIGPLHLVRLSNAAGWAVAWVALVGLAAGQVIMGWMRVRAGSVHASAAFYAMWMALNVRPEHTLRLPGVAIGAAVALTVATLLMWRWPPTHDRWPRHALRRTRDAS